LMLSPTQLGRAALVSSLPPDAALFVFSDLQQATKAIALDSELHMLLLRRTVLYGKDAIGIICILHLRFFSALALFDVVNEKSIDEVARRFRISRGTLQTLQQQSATYAAMVVAFCSRLGWTYLCDLLKGFASRLAFGVRRELTELVSIAGIDASRYVCSWRNLQY
uniref:HTH_Tnp_4 domain-containing protein n=1 Tax=Haemonchus placei TaxID=6290 RepID=A0A0N4WMK5_HAEPC